MNNKEMLMVVDTVSHEKGVSKDVLFGAIEVALATATKKRYGEDAEFRVSINRESGSYETFRVWLVRELDDEIVEDGEEFNPSAHLTLEDAKDKDPSLNLGDMVEEAVESVAFGRIAAQTAKQVIVQKVREAERAQVVNAYLPQVGQLIGGTVKKLGRDNIIVDLGNNAEGLLTRDHLIPRETFRVSDRLRAMLLEVNPDSRGPQLILSRTAPEMLVELFKIEVPEIAEDVIEIRGAARDPGSRAKIAVKTNDGRI
ncbi:MAG: transcription termination/antitermination protein NusA, partial [Gammaproteobacteria bacterium]|nr:transcription termination/antitermination protein NusA [Gammaproteobacteria bacterium]